MGIHSKVILGHDLLALERFQDDTVHMVIFDVEASPSPYGQLDQRLRLFLSESAYQELLAAKARGEVRILRHASVVEGHILPDKKPRGRHRR